MIILSYIAAFFKEAFILFLEMAPYLILGLSVAGLLSIIMSKAFVARHIGRNTLGSVLKASLLGVPLPLCSCGVVPTASYLKRAGASDGAVMGFLISTPQTGVDSIAATYGMLGPLFAVFRPVAALLTGLLGGIFSFITGKKKDNKQANPETVKEAPTSWKEKGKSALNFTFRESIDDMGGHFLVGVAIAALIALVIPDDFFAGTFIGQGFPAMLLMVVIGIPMYVCSTSSIPIALALITKGISPGAAYVFLVAGPATNAATLSILVKVLGRKQTALYVFSIIAGSLLFGPLMDWLVNQTGLAGMAVPSAHAGHLSFTALDYILSAFLFCLLAYSFYRKWKPGKKEACTCEHCHMKEYSEENEPREVLQISGMNCNHCAFNVKQALISVEGVTDAEINLSRREALITGRAEKSALAEAIRKAGYEVVPSV